MDSPSSSRVRIPVPRNAIDLFCRKWNVRELSFFGSVLTSEFRPDSDVDVLVEFSPTAHVSLLDFAEMENELSSLLEREVHLVEKDGLRNPFRRRAILGSREVVHAA